MFVSSRVNNIFSCSINKGRDTTDLSHSELSLLQPLHIVKDESVTLLFFIVPFQACSKEVLHKFKDLSGRDWARRNTLILYTLNMTLLRRYLPISKFYTCNLLTGQKEEAGKSVLI